MFSKLGENNLFIMSSNICKKFVLEWAYEILEIAVRNLSDSELYYEAGEESWNDEIIKIIMPKFTTLNIWKCLHMSCILK